MQWLSLGCIHICIYTKVLTKSSELSSVPVAALERTDLKSQMRE